MTLRYVSFLVALLMLTGVGTATAQNSVDLDPVKDNTLFEDDNGGLSNGVGIHLFAGVTNRGDIRRALLAFDVAGNLPTGATIDSVRLTLDMNMTVAGAQDMALHRVTADWGEGTSNAGTSNDGDGAPATTGDATWLHTFFNTATWSQSGGDFQAAASATTSVVGNGSYTWSGAGMTADVQTWLSNPADNFGWILVGNEGANRTAKRFVSREGASGPVLRIFFSLNTAAEETGEVPDAVRLAQNYPNPFRDETTIAYELESPQQVTLAVYDALGRQVTTLVDAVRGAGTHRAVFDAERLPPGVYVYRLDAGPTRRTRTMILLR